MKLITPFLMLFAGAVASIIMYVRHFDLYTMLWVLLVVLVVFYIIGDIVRYIYESIRPRIIPDMDEEELMLERPEDNIVAKEEGEDEDEQDTEKVGTEQQTEEESDAEEEPQMADAEEEPQMADASEEEGYTDENLD